MWGAGLALTALNAIITIVQVLFSSIFRALDLNSYGEKLKAVASRKSVWICGHSLGGALAVVAAFRCLRAGIPVRAVYTFGQPLVGEVSLREAFGDFNDRIFRFVNEKDPVPLIPVSGHRMLPRSEWRTIRRGKSIYDIKTKKVAFADIGRFYWFTDSGELEEGRQLPDRSKSMIRALIRGARGLLKGVLSLPRHEVDGYLMQLHALRKANTDRA